MSREIEHIHAGELHTRLSTQRWPSELNVLSASFDGMMTRLEASFTQLTRFSSDIAHELRGPINNLISAASVTQSKARSAEEYRGHAGGHCGRGRAPVANDFIDAVPRPGR